MKSPDTEYIEEMFDSIAPDYDALNHILSLDIDSTWRRRALKEIVDASVPQTVLDVACGTGDFSLQIAGAAHSGTIVHGLDLSEGMLSVMREKVKEAGMEEKILPLRGNSEEIHFPSDTFDRVTVAFGIRNFEHREKALGEILRVLVPGGRLVILELSVPSSPVLRWAYELYFLKVLPLVGGKVSGQRSAYRYLPASVLKFPGKEEWMETMRGCGFTNVSHRAFTCGICRMYMGEKSS